MADKTSNLVASALRQFVQVASEIKEEIAQGRVGERAAAHQPESIEKKRGRGGVMESAEEGGNNALEYTRIIRGDRTTISKRRTIPAMPRRPGKRDRGQVLDAETIQERMANFRTTPIAEALSTDKNTAKFLPRLQALAGSVPKPASAMPSGQSVPIPKSIARPTGIGGMASSGMSRLGASMAMLSTLGGFASIVGFPLTVGKIMAQLKDFGDHVAESTRRLAPFSSQLAAAHAHRDISELRRNITLSQNTGAGAARLVEESNRAADAWAPFQEFWTSFKNDAASEAARTSRKFAYYNAIVLRLDRINAEIRKQKGGMDAMPFYDNGDLHPYSGGLATKIVAGDNHSTQGQMHAPGMTHPWQGANQPGMVAVPGFHDEARRPKDRELPQSPKTGQHPDGPPAGKNLDAWGRRWGNQARNNPHPEGAE